ncbi:MAG: hypothetical protein IAF94_26335 [Pirellulaceae bacterium]|nr:hypothetical protein [Pirellulaceae bacterium]
MLFPLAGCAAMNLLEGKLPIGDEDDLGIVTRPYPGWESRAKATLDKIPTAGAKEQSAAPAPAAAVNIAASNVVATVTQEQPAVANPAVPEAAATSQLPAKVEEAPPQPLLVTNTPAAHAPLVNALVASAHAAADTVLAHPTHEHPLEVTGAEGTPLSPPPAAGDKK